MPCFMRLLMIIAFLSSSIAVLVVGPKFVRSNHDYTVVISNYFEQSTKISLRLLMEGYSFNGSTTFSIVKNVSVWNYKNRVVRFNVPSSSLTHDVKLTIEGQEGYSFYIEEQLVYLSTATAGLIQINKPVFKPGETMRFRVIVLDTEMKPPAGLESISVTIRDPQANGYQQWPSAKLFAGVFEGDLQMTKYGKWNIMVYLNEEELVSKSFEVIQYVTQSIDLQVTSAIIPLEGHQTLNLTIAAKSHVGKPVQGMASAELYMEDVQLVQVKEIRVNGRGQVLLQLHKQLEVGEDQQDVRVKVTFVEQYTNQSVTKDQVVSVYKDPYQATLSRECEEYHAEQPFKCVIILSHHDGRPARNVALWVDVSGRGFEHNQTFTTDHDGKIEVQTRPTESAEELFVIVTQDSNVLLWDKIYKRASIVEAFLKLQLMSSLRLNQRITLMATCNEEMSFLVYYVISKRNVVDEGYVRTFGMKKQMIEFNASENLLPKATVLVATVLNKTMIWESLDLDFKQMKNFLFVNLSQSTLRPGNEIELQLKGRPGAYIGLAAYDESLLGFSKQHDLFWKDVLDVFENFHSPDASEYDAFYSKGIFVKLSGGVQIGNTLMITDRSDRAIVERASNHEPLRANYIESWLWKNVILGSSGSLTLVEITPYRIASWYLTGFSIDPMHGFGIIRKPIQFTTFKSLYIADHLPKFIKRGKAVELQFTLFNYLEQEHTFNVTLYNVANQMQFFERPPEDQNYTQSVRVGPTMGVAVSFRVRVWKLGEVDILVRAYTLSVSETDEIEKVVRVVPESMLVRRIESSFFCHDTYKNQTFTMNLEILKKAEKGSTKAELIIDSNLHIPARGGLTDFVGLLLFHMGTENNYTSKISSIIIEYLNAIGSTKHKLAEIADNLKQHCYGALIAFCHQDCSYQRSMSVGTVFLTAFTVNALQIAPKYLNEVSIAVIQIAFDWLATKQHSSGRFDEVELTHVDYDVNDDYDIQRRLRNGVVLTSYVLIAFLENDNAKVKHAEVIKKGMRYVTNQFSNMSIKQHVSITDAYDMSIATYAIVLSDHPMKYDAIKKLNDIFIDSPPFSELFWKTPEQLKRIETTEDPFLSVVKTETCQDSIPIMHWLAEERQFVMYCIFRPQNCFVSLKALTKLLELRNDYSVQFNYNNIIRRFLFNSQGLPSSYNVEIADDTYKIDFDVSGIGLGLLQVVYQYRLDLRNFENHFNLSLEKQNTDSDIELRLKVCASYQHSTLAMVEVNFPSGYVVDDNPISEQTWEILKKDIEFRYGNTSLVLFYHKMSTRINCFTVTAYRRLKVALRRPAYVIVRDYYKPLLNAIQMYEVDDLQPCEISDNNDCVAEKKYTHDQN